MKETSPNNGDSYIPGDNYGLCGECGFKFHTSELKRRWDNLYVCKEDWEPKHPQESVRAKADKIRPDIISPESTDSFIETPITQDDL